MDILIIALVGVFLFLIGATMLGGKSSAQPSNAAPAVSPTSSPSAQPTKANAISAAVKSLLENPMSRTYDNMLAAFPLAMAQKTATMTAQSLKSYVARSSTYTYTETDVKNMLAREADLERRQKATAYDAMLKKIREAITPLEQELYEVRELVAGHMRSGFMSGSVVDNGKARIAELEGLIKPLQEQATAVRAERAAMWSSADIAVLAW